jgi:flagella basal body P-ring formation protein FlgA
MTLRRFALLGMLSVLGASVAGAGGVVHIPAEVSVEASVIALGDIAVFDGIAPDVEQRLAALAFGPAGDPASQQALEGERVRQAVQAIDSSLWVEVPDRISVHRTGERLARSVLQERVERAIRSRMPWPAGSVELHSWSLPDALVAPLGAKRLLVSFRPREDFRGRVPVELELVDPEHPEVRGARRSAAVDLEVRVPVAVATRRLRRGELLEADAIRFETRELRRLPDDVLTAPSAAVGQRLRVAVREGSPLLVGYLAAEDVVHRGDALVVDAGRDGLDLHIEVRALEGGALGQVIRARNPASRREFPVEVTGPRAGRLALPDTGDVQ